MDDLQHILEWVGAGLVAMLILIVVIMLSNLFNSGRKDNHWE